MLDLFSLPAFFFFFLSMDILNEYFCYLFEVLFTKKNLLQLGFWKFSLCTSISCLEDISQHFFPCSLLSILKALCSYFVKKFLNLSIWPEDLPYEKFPLFSRKVFLPFLTQFEPSSILKFQMSPAEVPWLNILPLVTLSYWSFEQPRSPFFSWGFLSCISIFPLFFYGIRSTWNYSPISVHSLMCFSSYKVWELCFFPWKSATGILIFFLVFTLFELCMVLTLEITIN